MAGAVTRTSSAGGGGERLQPAGLPRAGVERGAALLREQGRGEPHGRRALVLLPPVGRGAARAGAGRRAAALAAAGGGGGGGKEKRA